MSRLHIALYTPFFVCVFFDLVSLELFDCEPIVTGYKLQIGSIVTWKDGKKGETGINLIAFNHLVFA